MKVCSATHAMLTLYTDVIYYTDGRDSHSSVVSFFVCHSLSMKIYETVT